MRLCDSFHEVLGAGNDDLGLSADVHADLVSGSSDSGDDTGQSVEPGVRHTVVDAGVDDDVDLFAGLEGLESPGDGGKTAGPRLFLEYLACFGSGSAYVSVLRLLIVNF